jgi:hypothetical protein
MKRGNEIHIIVFLWNTIINISNQVPGSWIKILTPVTESLQIHFQTHSVLTNASPSASVL